MTLRRRLLILAFGGILVLGAACGDSKDSSNDVAADNDTPTTVSSNGTADNSASSGKGCNTLTKVDVEGIFGPGFTDVEDSTTSGTTICTFKRDDPVTTAQFVIKPSSAGEYDATIEASKDSGATAQTVSGIGDKATRLTTTKYGITVVQTMVVKGSALFYVTVTSQDAAASAKADDFAKKLAAQL